MFLDEEELVTGGIRVADRRGQPECFKDPNVISRVLLVKEEVEMMTAVVGEAFVAWKVGGRHKACAQLPDPPRSTQRRSPAV